MNNKYVEIDVETVAETEFAVLFSDGDNKKWFPLSQIITCPEKGKTGTAVVTEWVATMKGWI